MKHIIIGTAGHVDHGKTSLVKALTGKDLDVLKEEKLRGITIENGYSYFDLNKEKRAAIIDVPGHEKFIKNMIGGASSIDVVILVIAADEGIMPQTIEHFNILKLLGIKSGLIALTKRDLVDDEFIELVKEDILQLTKGSFLENSKIIEINNKNKEGINQLIEEINNLVDKAEEKNKEALFRMPIDRIFSVKGIGTIVTGTVLGGNISIDDEIELFPGNILSKVRSLEVHNEKREKALAGERVAINLPNIKKEQLKRGMIIGEPAREISSFIIDCKITMVKGCNKTLKNRERIRVYCNTNEIIGRIILLDRDELKAEESANVQIRLEGELSAKIRDRVVIRTYSPMETIAGGVVLEPNGKKAKRFNSNYISQLKLKESGSVKERVEQYILKSEEFTATIDKIIDNFNLSKEEVIALLEQLKSEKLIIEIIKDLYIHSSYLVELERLTENYLNEYYKKEPFKFSVNKEGLKKAIIKNKIKSNLFIEILKLLKERKIIDFNETSVWSYAREIKLTEEERVIKDNIINHYLKAKFKTDKIEEVIEKEKNKNKAKEIYNYLIDKGELIYIGDSITLHKENYKEVKAKIIEFIKENGAIELADLKEITNSSRKYLVAILEKLDRDKITKRTEEGRVLIANN